MENKLIFRRLCIALVTLGAFCTPALVPAHQDKAGSGPPGESPLESALIASHERGAPFFLRVDCVSDKGARNLRLFPDGTAIWDDRLEVELPPQLRRALAGLLREGGLTSLAPEYGAKIKPDERKAPLRVSCAVEFRTDVASKRSRQYVDGYQSAPLNDLANALLDRVAPVAEARGIGIESLADGLKKLAAGHLSAHGFRLSLVELPADGSSGMIMQINGDTASIRSYAPGAEVGEVAMLALDDARLGRLANALRDAGIESLPVNLWAANQLELEVEMLDRRKTLIARQFMRLSAETLGESQRRFDQMIGELRRIRSELQSGDDL